MVVSTREVPNGKSAPALQPGPSWASFEQFRLSGVEGLRAALGHAQVGRVNVKGEEFAIMRGDLFNSLYGTAQDVDRLNWQLRLIEQAIELLGETGGSQTAVEHLRDLVSQVHGDPSETRRQTELVFDEDELPLPDDYAAGDHEVELDPARVRVSWTRG